MIDFQESVEDTVQNLMAPQEFVSISKQIWGIASDAAANERDSASAKRGSTQLEWRRARPSERLVDSFAQRVGKKEH